MLSCTLSVDVHRHLADVSLQHGSKKSEERSSPKFKKTEDELANN